MTAIVIATVGARCPKSGADVGLSDVEARRKRVDCPTCGRPLAVEPELFSGVMSVARAEAYFRRTYPPRAVQIAGSWFGASLPEHVVLADDDPALWREP